MGLDRWLRIQACNRASFSQTMSGEEIGCRLDVAEKLWGWGRGKDMEAAFQAAFDSDQPYSHRHIEDRRGEWAEFMDGETNA